MISDPKMSSKKEDGWTECCQCKKYFPKKSLNQHQNVCILRQEDVDDKSFEKLQAGYIDKGVLFGKLLKTASKKSMLTSC